MRTEREVVCTELERLAVWYTDVGVRAIEGAAFEIDAVIDTVILMTRIVAAVSLQFPMTDESRLSA